MSKTLKKNKTIRCSWEHHRFDNKNNEFVKCSSCGRIKRIDLPDAQACTGSKNSHAVMIKRILGGELIDKEIQEIEKEE